MLKKLYCTLWDLSNCERALRRYQESTGIDEAEPLRRCMLEDLGRDSLHATYHLTERTRDHLAVALLIDLRDGQAVNRGTEIRLVLQLLVDDEEARKAIVEKSRAEVERVHDR